MARPRQPIALIQAKGRKNLTKEEIARRIAEEVQPCADDLRAPSYLTIKQKTHFEKLASQLSKIKILGETDVEALARYVTAEAQYESATKDLRALVRAKPKQNQEDPAEYLILLGQWVDTQERLAKLQDRYFKQAHTAATALGLTISSRCKLVVPKAQPEPKPNKFQRFNQGAG